MMLGLFTTSLIHRSNTSLSVEASVRKANFEQEASMWAETLKLFDFQMDGPGRCDNDEKENHT